MNNQTQQDKWEEYLRAKKVKFGKYYPFLSDADKQEFYEIVKACKAKKYFKRLSTEQNGRISKNSPIYLLSLLPWDNGNPPILELIDQDELQKHLKTKVHLEENSQYAHDCIWKNLFITSPVEEFKNDPFYKSIKEVATKNDLEKMTGLREHYNRQLQNHRRPQDETTPLEANFDIHFGEKSNSQGKSVTEHIITKLKEYKRVTGTDFLRISQKDLVSNNMFQESLLFWCCKKHMLIDFLFSEYTINYEHLFHLNSEMESPFYWLCINTYSGLHALFKKYDIKYEDLVLLNLGKRSPFYWLCRWKYDGLNELFETFDIKHKDLFQIGSDGKSAFYWLCHHNYDGLSELFKKYDIKYEELFQLTTHELSPFYHLCAKNYDGLKELFKKYDIKYEELFQLTTHELSPFYHLCAKNYDGLNELFKNYDVKYEDLFHIDHLFKMSPFYYLCFNNYERLNELFKKYRIKHEDLFQVSRNNRCPFYCLCSNNYIGFPALFNSISPQDFSRYIYL